MRTTREFGMAVRRMREEAGLSQQGLADRAGVSRRWLLNLENGKPNVDFFLVLNCLDALDARLQLTHPDGEPWQF
ncbi:MAG: helix-turn-helix domain-containing protein [Arthrobacter sp.]|uniref:helix-turn-helix domain-containing protein n=1 Tax=Arthrobacter sp. AOP36-A1-22 TaxID=3457684 RepID=UPI0026526E28|nr:helix-turn-helix domain-containing protein [Micrococcaceae bacterium]MDN5823561.1 helix-turn-helix domain-containing protein [Micrococcaceae bacterium]MDN5880618.1 helix-turn-helix domain-containing protein [Micrococcaceae bacterium]MDN5887984.1 helix-turn-helix domain-containing protein [Micrococcaceae bacterium]MDN5905751.1 helix-turn-helix domain-containing protein [Micrococcaceae bacterium]